MGNLPASLLAAVAAITLLGVGWLALHLSRTGFDYAAARGNPRNRAQAHEALWDIGKGAALIVGAPLLAAFIIATIHF